MLGEISLPPLRTVLVADDNANVRTLLRRLITPLADVRECAGGAEAVALYPDLRPDCVLMDIRMDGVEATVRIRRVDPTARVVVVTGIREPAVLDAARRAGACEVLIKDDLLDVPRLLNTLLQDDDGGGRP